MSAIFEVKQIRGRRGPRRAHEHEEHSLIFVSGGSTRGFAAGSALAASKGQAVLIPAGLPHSCSPLSYEEWSYTLILVKPGRSASLDSFLERSGDGAIVIDAPTRLSKATLAAADRGADDCCLAAMEELLAAACCDLRGLPDREGAAPGGEGPDAASLRAERLMRSALERGLSLDELAIACGMGKYELARRFKRDFGLGPHAYLLNLRVNEAKKMIAAGAGAAETALACGFCDQSHFTRVFERTVGLPPAAYARLAAQERTRPAS